MQSGTLNHCQLEFKLVQPHWKLKKKKRLERETAQGQTSPCHSQKVYPAVGTPACCAQCCPVHHSQEMEQPTCLSGIDDKIWYVEGQMAQAVSHMETTALHLQIYVFNVEYLQKQKSRKRQLTKREDSLREER